MAANLKVNKIKNFEIKDFIGKGQFGEVYTVIRDSDQKIFAVKIIDKINLLTIPGLQKQHLQEVTFMDQVNSPNVIKLIDYVESQSRCYIFMDLCDTDLEKILMQRHRLTESEAINYLKQLVKGFGALHQLRIIHRDLKAGNIFLKDGIAKIGDLGFARKCESENINGTRAGTPIIMAPEILKGEQYGIKVDIWSLGVVFYQMLYGEYPFFGTQLVEILIQAQAQKINFDKNGVKIGAKTEDFIRKCLKYNPNERISWAEIFEHPLIKEQFSTPDDIELIENSVIMYESYTKDDENQEQMDNQAQEKVQDFMKDRNNWFEEEVKEIINPSKEQNLQEAEFQMEAENKYSKEELAIIQKTLWKYRNNLRRYQEFGKVLTEGMRLQDQNFVDPFNYKPNLEKSNSDGERIFLWSIAQQYQNKMSFLFESLTKCQNNYNLPKDQFQLFINSQECKEFKKYLSELINNLIVYKNGIREIAINGLAQVQNKQLAQNFQKISKDDYMTRETFQQEFKAFYLDCLLRFYETGVIKKKNLMNAEGPVKRINLFLNDMLDCYFIDTFDKDYQINPENMDHQQYSDNLFRVSLDNKRIDSKTLQAKVEVKIKKINTFAL